jgi:hypothetical protein
VAALASFRDRGGESRAVGDFALRIIDRRDLPDPEAKAQEGFAALGVASSIEKDPVNPRYSSCGITVYHAKMEEVLPRLPEKHFSVLVLDPPYTFQPDRTEEMIAPFRHCLTNQAEVLILGLIEGMTTVSEFGHPHARPLEQVRAVLEKTKGAILDPYMGVGATLVAAKQLGREAVGIEMDGKRCDVAIARLENRLGSRWPQTEVESAGVR